MKNLGSKNFGPKIILLYFLAELDHSKIMIFFATNSFMIFLIFWFKLIVWAMLIPWGIVIEQSKLIIQSVFCDCFPHKSLYHHFLPFNLVHFCQFSKNSYRNSSNMWYLLLLLLLFTEKSKANTLSNAMANTLSNC